ncbi:hypothetical protein NDU88_008437 [Pleurodeles waltl]|uniref:Uncharacterized protein n=1 Tax=Pleurodeles waltl TaxID=8319 RepID=A0AAV7PPH1_PLEWA|nr:hypothetical protein NDU88_008437 [Pleurodeles waltl]
MFWAILLDKIMAYWADNQSSATSVGFEWEAVKVAMTGRCIANKGEASAQMHSDIQQEAVCAAWYPWVRALQRTHTRTPYSCELLLQMAQYWRLPGGCVGLETWPDADVHIMGDLFTGGELASF